MPAPYQPGWYQLAPGVKRQIVTVGQQLLSTHVYLAPGAELEVPAMPNEQISYVIEGLVRITMGDTEITTDHGEGVAIPKDTPYRVTAVKESMLLECFTPVRDDILALMLR